jgi:hypothetical protein
VTEGSPSFPIVREAVASFPDRDHFHHAVSSLLAAGFESSDLSVLASHDSLAAAGEPGEAAPKLVPAGVSDEIKYIAPLTVAGIILLSGGPIAATVAALVAAGLGGAALKELFDDYTAPAQRGRCRGAARRRRPPLGALRRFGTRADRDAHPRRGRRASRPRPWPPVPSDRARRLIIQVNRRASAVSASRRAQDH